VDVAVLSGGTDGTDGPTDAAGGVVDRGTNYACSRPQLRKALAEHDAYPLLEEVGGLIITGPTGTNVADVHIIIAK